jgi:hypothetical protein
MTTNEVTEFLEHFGVSGMKWGVRSRSSGSSSGGRSGKQSPTAHMSNEDLQKIVTRMRLDQQYSELSSAKKRAGATYTHKVLKQSGNILVSAAAAALAGAVIKGVMGSGKKAITNWVP